MWASIFFSLLTVSSTTLLKQPFGEFSSPNYPLGYPALVNQTWDISAPRGYIIKLYIPYLDVQSSEGCQSSYIQVLSDGSQMARLCGQRKGARGNTALFEFYSTSNSMRVSFRANTTGGGSFSGFLALYSRVDINECEVGSPECSHFCGNTIGGYRCYCPIGFELQSDGHMCKNTGAMCSRPHASNSVLMPLWSEFHVRDRVKVVCTPGHEIVQGLTTIPHYFVECQQDGTWTTSSYKCQPVDCAFPPEIRNGRAVFLTGSGVTTYKSSIQYQCDKPYYEMSPGNPGNFTCTRDGTWETKRTGEALPHCSPVCGKPSVPVVFRQRILRGSVAKRGNFPWQVLFRPVKGAGALIAERWVLTAAHVVHNAPKFSLYGGHTDTRQLGAASQLHHDRVFIHPGYQDPGPTADTHNYDNDIALIRLWEPVVAGPNLSPICLPVSGSNLELGKVGIVAGWGITENQTLPYQLMFTRLPVRELGECQDLVSGHSVTVTDNMICAGNGEGSDSCQGDSGGAYVFSYPKPNRSRFFIGGIVSWGVTCGTVGFYTKVANYLDWIQEIMESETTPQLYLHRILLLHPLWPSQHRRDPLQIRSTVRLSPVGPLSRFLQLDHCPALSPVGPISSCLLLSCSFPLACCTALSFWPTVPLSPTVPFSPIGPLTCFILLARCPTLSHWPTVPLSPAIALSPTAPFSSSSSLSHPLLLAHCPVFFHGLLSHSLPLASCPILSNWPVVPLSQLARCPTFSHWPGVPLSPIGPLSHSQPLACSGPYSPIDPLSHSLLLAHCPVFSHCSALSHCPVLSQRLAVPFSPIGPMFHSLLLSCSLPLAQCLALSHWPTVPHSPIDPLPCSLPAALCPTLSQWPAVPLSPIGLLSHSLQLARCPTLPIGPLSNFRPLARCPALSHWPAVPLSTVGLLSHTLPLTHCPTLSCWSTVPFSPTVPLSPTAQFSPIGPLSNCLPLDHCPALSRCPVLSHWPAVPLSPAVSSLPLAQFHALSHWPTNPLSPTVPLSPIGPLPRSFLLAHCPTLSHWPSVPLSRAVPFSPAVPLSSVVPLSSAVPFSPIGPLSHSLLLCPKKPLLRHVHVELRLGSPDGSGAIGAATPPTKPPSSIRADAEKVLHWIWEQARQMLVMLSASLRIQEEIQCSEAINAPLLCLRLTPSSASPNGSVTFMRGAPLCRGGESPDLSLITLCSGLVFSLKAHLPAPPPTAHHQSPMIVISRALHRFTIPLEQMFHPFLELNGRSLIVRLWPPGSGFKNVNSALSVETTRVVESAWQGVGRLHASTARESSLPRIASPGTDRNSKPKDLNFERSLSRTAASRAVPNRKRGRMGNRGASKHLCKMGARLRIAYIKLGVMFKSCKTILQSLVPVTSLQEGCGRTLLVMAAFPRMVMASSDNATLFGEIVLPNYQAGETLRWEVGVPPGFALMFHLRHYDGESSSACRHNYVEAFADRHLLGRFCGNITASRFHRPSLLPGDPPGSAVELRLRCHSSGPQARRGFSVSYEAVDIDECGLRWQGQATCHHFCHNYIGGYQCYCHHGYSLQLDGKTCKETECDVPANLENGSFEYVDGANGTQTGLVIRYRCHRPYYTMTSGANGLYSCQNNGKWMNSVVGETLPVCEPVCGRPRNPPMQKQRILGGSPAEEGAFPWHVYMESMVCGGALLSDRWVLTSASCVDSRTSQRMLAGAAHTDALVQMEPLQASEIRIHPAYSRSPPAHDIALVRLSQPLRMGASLSPICLPGRHPSYQPDVGRVGLVSGFGQTEYFALSDVLLFAPVPVVEREKCVENSAPGARIPLGINVICAGSGGVDACTGDGGGSLVFLDPLRPGTYYTGGVVSWGYQCGSYGIYTNVQDYLEWIENVMAL
ncbi:uncharacterized protein [Narcine bancroftii]|uniref:uncharacterized protein n=1 Tax=Narcine bancroftii TaxID=1343680 RepID=UPI003831EDEE